MVNKKTKIPLISFWNKTRGIVFLYTIVNAIRKLSLRATAKQSKPLRLLRAIALAMTFACNHIYYVYYMRNFTTNVRLQASTTYRPV